MNRNHITIALALLGLGAAWYWSRRQSAQLAGILRALPQNPAPVGFQREGQPLYAVSEDGDMSAPYGTDLILPGIDPFDPTLDNIFVGPIDTPSYEPGGSNFVGPVMPRVSEDGQ